VCIYGKHDKLQQFIITCMMQVACECNSCKGILVVAQLHQEDVKDGYDVYLLQPYIFFIFSSYVPTCYGVYVLMFVLEGELKSHAHAFVFVCVSSEPGDGSS
jgi:hypothetical protein